MLPFAIVSRHQELKVSCNTDDPGVPRSMKVTEDIGMTTEELAVIGEIVAQWGSIEHEIFVQTVETFVGSNFLAESLPKEMNNLNFLEVLSLWKERVVENSGDKTRVVFLAQYEALCRLAKYRNAIVHGMWEWSEADPKILITTRVRKKEILSIQFNPGDLHNLAKSLGEINFLIRCPDGLEDTLRDALHQDGYYVNTAVWRRMQIDSE